MKHNKTTIANGLKLAVLRKGRARLPILLGPLLTGSVTDISN